jgi:hypothetical protein
VARAMVLAFALAAVAIGCATAVARADTSPSATPMLNLRVAKKVAWREIKRRFAEASWQREASGCRRVARTKARCVIRYLVASEAAFCQARVNVTRYRYGYDAVLRRLEGWSGWSDHTACHG